MVLWQVQAFGEFRFEVFVARLHCSVRGKKNWSKFGMELGKKRFVNVGKF